jgi:tetratricopeptide (TPR) repeat protein
MMRSKISLYCVLFTFLVFTASAFAQIKPVRLSDFSEGLMALMMPTQELKDKTPDDEVKYWGKCGYKNNKGEWEIPAQFDWAGPFHEGYALVVHGSRIHSEVLFSKWEKTGYSKIRKGGLTIMLDGGSLGVIDKTGRILIDLPKLDGKLVIRRKWAMGSGGGIISRIDPNYPVYVNSKLDAFYSTETFHFQEGRAVVQLPNGCNYLQRSGDSLTYAFSRPFSICMHFSQGLAGIMDSSKKWGFIGTDGQWRIPASYPDVYSFSEGLAAVKVGKLWGAINKYGEMVIPAKYQRGFTFSEGLAYVNDSRISGFIDHRDQVVLDVSSIAGFGTEGGQFEDGIVLLTTYFNYIGGTPDSIFLDRNGNKILHFYGQCVNYSKGVARCWSEHESDSWLFNKQRAVLAEYIGTEKLSEDFAASPRITFADSSSPTSSTLAIKDKAEYDAYMSALSLSDPDKRAAALEAFAGKYPNSVANLVALEGAMFTYAQSGVLFKAANLAQLVLKSDPNHVRALAILTYINRSDAFTFNDGSDPAIKAGNEVGLYAERGLKALQGWKKPDSMSDEVYDKAHKRAEAILNGGAGFGALRRMDFRSARDYFRKALAIQSDSLFYAYQLGLAELEMQPLDVNGFWHVGKAIQLARTQNMASLEYIIAAYGKAKYSFYHGNDDGWDDLVAQAKELSPPPGFTVRPGSPPGLQVNQNAGNKPASGDANLDAAPAELEGAILRKKGDLDGAIRAYREAIQLNPVSAHLRGVLASILYDKRDFDAAIRESDEAIRLDPNVASAYYFRGASYQQKAEYYKALADYNRALHFDPKYTNALGGRADVYYFTRQNQLAIEDYTAFIEAFPKSSVAYLRRAACHFDLKEYLQSVADYEKAIVLDPNLLEAYNGLAWMMATSPADGIRNGLKAVGYGEKALSLAGPNQKFLYMDTLAAAYAEAGRFTDAVATQTKAIALIPKDYDAKEAAQFKARLQSYKDNKPWRDQPSL